MPIQLAAEAENGREALAYMQTMPIDIVITDMRMPVCDGSQMLKQMESLHYNCEIIVLSEYSDFSYMYQAIHAHVFDYLLKPIDPAQLNRLLQELVERLALRAPAAEAEEPLHTLFHKAMTGTLCDPKTRGCCNSMRGKHLPPAACAFAANPTLMHGGSGSFRKSSRHRLHPHCFHTAQRSPSSACCR